MPLLRLWCSHFGLLNYIATLKNLFVFNKDAMQSKYNVGYFVNRLYTTRIKCIDGLLNYIATLKNLFAFNKDAMQSKYNVNIVTIK
jgi:hypothetical protein